MAAGQSLRCWKQCRKGAGVLPWEGRGRGLEEERRRLGVKTSSGCCWKKVHWQLSLEFVVYIILLPHSYVPISVIDFDNMYTLPSWYCTHRIKVGLLFLGATGLLMDYGGTFSLVATLAVNTAPYRRELHQSIRPYGPGLLDLPDIIHSGPLHPLDMARKIKYTKSIWSDRVCLVGELDHGYVTLLLL